PVHGSVVQSPESASVAVRKDGLTAEFGDDGAKTGGNFVEGLVPGDAIEGGRATLAAGRGPLTAHGIEHAVRRVNAVEILGDLGTEESAGDGMRRVTLDSG